MPLTTMKEMLSTARREHRAIGAFNVANYEGAAAVVQAAEAEQSPVISRQSPESPPGEDPKNAGDG